MLIQPIDDFGQTNELKFMLLLLKRKETMPEDIRGHVSQIDWDAFLDFVIHHRVFPLIYLRIKNMGEDLIPERVTSNLHKLYKNNTIRMMQLTREMCEICSTLTESGIRTLQLKGPILALQLYGELSYRTSKDLDLLIGGSDVAKTTAILHQLGYQSDQTDQFIFWEKKSHHMSFFHPEKSIQVEIHWRLNPNIISSPSFEELWRRKGTITVYNQEFHHLGNEDLLAYLADHGARHGWSRLRWLLDVERLVNDHQIEKEGLTDYFKRYGGEVYVQQAVWLCETLLGSNLRLKQFLPNEANRKSVELAELALTGIQYGPNMSDKYVAKYKRNIHSAMTPKQKALLLVKKLLPSSLDAEVLPIAKPFFFLYIPLRPFLWFWRLMKRT